MIRVVRNPSEIDEKYVSCLNACFPGKWCRDSYHWYLKRSYGGVPPDIIVVYENDELAAGIGVNYRQVNVGGYVVNVAILTAAWTLPAFQGRWHFARLIKSCREVAKEKGCVAVLSFVTEKNASAKFLRRFGAYSVPTRYIKAKLGVHLNIPSALPEICPIKSADVTRNGNNCEAITFHYSSGEHWEGQFVHRVHPVVSVNIGNVSAIVEPWGETDRLQCMSDMSGDHAAIALAAIARNSQRSSRHLFCFTSSESLAVSAEKMGMKVDAGHMMIIDLPSETSEDAAALLQLRESSWRVQAGDRM